DLHTGEVFYNRHLYDLMTEPEKGLFKVHEGNISLRNHPFEDTTPIRKKTSAMLSDPAFAPPLLDEMTVARFLRFVTGKYTGFRGTIESGMDWGAMKPFATDCSQFDLDLDGYAGEHVAGYVGTHFEDPRVNDHWFTVMFDVNSMKQIKEISENHLKIQTD